MKIFFVNDIVVASDITGVVCKSLAVAFVLCDGVHPRGTLGDQSVVISQKHNLMALRASVFCCLDELTFNDYLTMCTQPKSSSVHLIHVI